MAERGLAPIRPVTAVNVGAPTCATLTSAYMDTSVHTSTQVFALDACATSQFNIAGSTALVSMATSGLSITTPGAGTYAFDMDVLLSTPAGGGFKFDFGAGNISTSATQWIGDNVPAGNSSGVQTSLTSTYGSTVSAVYVRFAGYLVSTSGTTFIPRFAQNAASGTSSVLAGSCMHLHRAG